MKYLISDLQSTKLIYLKGFLFFLILLLSSFLILNTYPSLKIFFLLILVIWSSARSYYFMFYVIEKYTDKNYKFSGIYAFLVYLMRQRIKK
ncbi:Uncharacterised protein [Candidatus Venteria ishoeyi]|uniref:Uncharacterized protein n=1 Tax=Candidatus Venteria ishoeyi TaxID=1899563 RepID=A0A1H6FFD6_9GAMM|nr:Uncharacterised protein [Candidatus Venteria ishoeyi]